MTTTMMTMMTKMTKIRCPKALIRCRGSQLWSVPKHHRTRLLGPAKVPKSCPCSHWEGLCTLPTRSMYSISLNQGKCTTTRLTEYTMMHRSCTSWRPYLRPGLTHAFATYDSRYRQMYSDILMNGSKKFVVSMSHPSTPGRFASVGVVFEVRSTRPS